MKNKAIIISKIVICFLLVLTLSSDMLCSVASAKSSKYAAGDLEKVIDGILAIKQSKAKVSSVQDLIDTELAQKAGTNPTDWYMIALTRYKEKYNSSSYIQSLDSYVKKTKNLKATDLQRIALVYSACEENEEWIQNTLKESVGQLGIMSYVYGLILMDSRDYTVEGSSQKEIVKRILELRLSDGGWTLTGKTSDVDVTAMTLQALAPYYKDKDVKAAIEGALTFLSKRQLKTGDYKSWGIRSCESVAQVITALCALDIDCQTDKRFIKNKKTLIDGLMLYKNKDGSFSHTIKGTSNDTASVQAMYSLIAVWRQVKGLDSYYNFVEGTDAVNTGSVSGISENTIDGSEQDSTGQKTENSTSSVEENNNPAIAENTSHAMDIRVLLTILVSAIVLIYLAVLAWRTTLYKKEFLKDEHFNEELNKEGLDKEELHKKELLRQEHLKKEHHREMLLMKKKNKKKLLFLVAVTGCILFGIWNIHFQSVEDYYQTGNESNTANSETATISIRCDSVVGEVNSEGIPKDGIILGSTSYAIKKGDSAFDLLVRATKQNKIQLDYEGAGNDSLDTIYIKGINQLYEYDYGDLSGWMYKVNGEFISEGCNSYLVSDKDVIEWVYTRDLGKDVGED